MGLRIGPPPLSLSEYTTKDSEDNDMLPNHAYQAVSAGYVSVLGTPNATNQDINIFVGLTNDPAGAGIHLGAQDSSLNVSDISADVLVAKGEYFEVTENMGTSCHIYWKSFGILQNPIDFN